MTTSAARRVLVGGWVQQLAAAGSLLLFNVVAPSMVGLTAFGEFAAAMALTSLASGVLLGGYDLYALKIGQPDGLDHPALRRLAAHKLLGLVGIAVAIVAFGGVLFPQATRPSALALAAALFAIAQGLSSLLINAVLGAGRAASAVRLSAMHGVLHLAVPWGLAGVATGEGLTVALAGTYLVAVLFEVLVLSRLPHAASAQAAPAMGAVLAGAAPTWFDAARGGGALYLGSLVLPPPVLAIARLVIGLQQGVASLLPISQTAITALARTFDEDAAYQRMVATTTLSASAIAAAGAAVGTSVLGILAYATEAAMLSRLAPAAAIGAAIAVMLRQQIGTAAGLRSGTRLAETLLVPALATATLPAVGAAVFGVSGFLYATALAPAAALYRLGYRVPRPGAELVIVLVAVVALAAAVPAIGRVTGSPVLAVGLAVAASAAYAARLWWIGGLPVLRRAPVPTGDAR